MDSLRSELQQMFQTQLEEVVRPLKDEVSTIKLWLARVANYLERTEMPSEEPSASDMAGLFGPCSPVHRSPTPSVLASLAAACTSSDPLVCEDVCEGVVDSIMEAVITSEEIHVISTSDQTLSQAVPFYGLSNPITSDVSSTTTKVPTRTPAAQMHLDAPMEQITLQATPIEDVVVVEDASVDEDSVVVEDASDDEESSLDVNLMINDPIVAVAVADGSTHVETMTDELESLVEPLMKDASLMDFAAMKVNSLACPPDHPPPSTAPLTTATTRWRKSYDKSLLRRSARLAQRKLKDLGILGNDGKLDEDAIQEYADCLKELVPPDLLESLMCLKGRAFWDVVAGISLPLR
ncbi:unnamed protein product [Urochloa humidicola]